MSVETKPERKESPRSPIFILPTNSPFITREQVKTNGKEPQTAQKSYNPEAEDAPNPVGLLVFAGVAKVLDVFYKIQDRVKKPKL